VPANAPANNVNAPAKPSPAPAVKNLAVKKPGRVTTFIADRFTLWGKWTIGILFACFAIACLLVYLAVQWVTYTTLVWGNGANNAVTLVRDIGHGGVSEVTVTFSDHTLLVTEVDNNDPGRVTVMKVNEQIMIPDDSSVLTASLQSVLQPGRLDLVIKLKGGLAYHTEFTTLLINNVEAVRQNPQAPGFRAPTAAELSQALQKLGS
jgi:hypothetical protein